MKIKSTSNSDLKYKMISLNKITTVPTVFYTQDRIRGDERSTHWNLFSR